MSTGETKSSVREMLRDAATVLLLRDIGEGLEVFMVRRHERIEFASGALVFPGGAVDEDDRAPRLAARVDIDAGRLEARELAWRLAGIRELYEEAGVLLARSPGSGALVDTERLRDVNMRYREVLAAHRLALSELSDSEDLELALSELVPFAHWVTPAGRPKRFDTRFYLAAMPAGQRAVHDGRESVESVWGRPADLIEQAEAGRWSLRFPTRVNLEKLAASASVADALERARSAPVVRILTVAEKVAGGARVRIPLEAGYGFAEALLDEQGVLISRC